MRRAVDGAHEAGADEDRRRFAAQDRRSVVLPTGIRSPPILRRASTVRMPSSAYPAARAWMHNGFFKPVSGNQTEKSRRKCRARMEAPMKRHRGASYRTVVRTRVDAQ